MSSTAYPEPPSGPLPVRAGAVSARIAVAEHAGVDPVTGRTLMYLRLVQLADGAPASRPGIRLAVDAGPAVEVGTTRTPVGAPTGGGPVAVAVLIPEPDGILLVDIEVIRSGAAWSVQISNGDTRDHRYVWVVADTVDETRRPWLDLPTAGPALSASVGQTAPPADLLVANHGTGPVTLHDPDGAALGSGFTLVAVTLRVVGPNRGAVARISFTAGPTPGPVTASHTFGSDDPDAGAVDGHNNRVTFSATVLAPALWRPGDVVVLIDGLLHRLDLTTGALTAVTTERVPAVAVAVNPRDGDAYLLSSSGIVRVEHTNGAQHVLDLSPWSGFSAPRSFAVDAAGTIVVLDLDPATPMIRRIDARTGHTTATAGYYYPDPRGLALEASGHAVVANHGSGTSASVVRVDRATGTSSILASGGELSGPVGGPLAIAVEPGGTIVALRDEQGAAGGTSWHYGNVIRIDPQSGGQVLVTGHYELASSRAAAMAADGTLLVLADRGLVAVDLHPGGAARVLVSSPVTAMTVVPPLPG